MRNNKIEGVELLSTPSDEAAIRQAKTLFETRANENYDSFEVWEERRLVYRSSDAAETPDCAGFGGSRGAACCQPQERNLRQQR